LRINLIPEHLRPARTSLIPYVPVAGVLAICAIWLVSQFDGAAGAREQLHQARSESARLRQELSPFNTLPARKQAAAARARDLKSRAALVSALTTEQHSFVEYLEAVAQSAPAHLRLTQVVFDGEKGTGEILGYGSAEKAAYDIASLLRSLNARAAVQDSFGSVELKSSTDARKGKRTVKMFSLVGSRAAAPATKDAGTKEADPRG
jgi:Tfp pilus assembly protein PilN